MNDPRGILLFLMLFGLPFVASVNFECRKHFICVNATYFNVCVDFGDGKLTAIESMIYPCPSGFLCNETNINECQLPLVTTTIIPSGKQTSLTDKNTTIFNALEAIGVTTPLAAQTSGNSDEAKETNLPKHGFTKEDSKEIKDNMTNDNVLSTYLITEKTFPMKTDFATDANLENSTIFNTSSSVKNITENEITVHSKVLDVDVSAKMLLNSLEFGNILANYSVPPLAKTTLSELQMLQTDSNIMQSQTDRESSLFNGSNVYIKVLNVTMNNKISLSPANTNNNLSPDNNVTESIPNTPLPIFKEFNLNSDNNKEKNTNTTKYDYYSPMPNQELKPMLQRNIYSTIEKESRFSGNIPPIEKANQTENIHLVMEDKSKQNSYTTKIASSYENTTNTKMIFFETDNQFFDTTFKIQTVPSTTETKTTIPIKDNFTLNDFLNRDIQNNTSTEHPEVLRNYTVQMLPATKTEATITKTNDTYEMVISTVNITISSLNDENTRIMKTHDDKNNSFNKDISKIINNNDTENNTVEASHNLVKLGDNFISSTEEINTIDSLTENKFHNSFSYQLDKDMNISTKASHVKNEKYIILVENMYIVNNNSAAANNTGRIGIKIEQPTFTETTATYVPLVRVDAITLDNASEGITDKSYNKLMKTTNSPIDTVNSPIKISTTISHLNRLNTKEIYKTTSTENDMNTTISKLEKTIVITTANDDLPSSTENIIVATNGSEYVNWMSTNISNIRDVKISTTFVPTTEIITSIKSATEQAVIKNSSIENVNNVTTEENLVITSNASETVTFKMNNKYNETRNKFSEISSPLLLTLAKINNFSQTISNQPKDESITTIGYSADDAHIEIPLINNTAQAKQKSTTSMDYQINDNETNPIYNSATFYYVTNNRNKSDMIENIKQRTPEHTENVPFKEGQLSIEATEMHIPSVITETTPKTSATIYNASKESTNKLDNYLMTTSNTEITKSFPPIESTTTMNVVAAMTNNNNDENSEYKLSKNVSKSTLNSTFRLENATEKATPNEDLPLSTEKIEVPTNGSEYVNWMLMSISNIRNVKISTTFDSTTEIITTIKSDIEQTITVNSSIENVNNINTEENLIITSNVSETVTVKMNNKYNETRNKFSEISGPLLLTPAKINNYSQTISNQPKDESITTIEYNAGDALIETPLINNTTQAIRKWSISMDYKINENETNPIYNSATFYNVTNYRNKSDMIENINETTTEHTENVPIKEGQLSIETTEMYIPSVITETIPKTPATIYSASKESTNKLDNYLLTTSNTKITKSFPPIESTTTMNVVAGMTIVKNATEMATPNEDLPISTEKIEVPTNGSEYVNWMPMNISNIRDVKISTTSDPTTEIITTIKSAIEQAITVNSSIENVYNINTVENLVNTSNISETVTFKINNKYNETRNKFSEISGPLLLTPAKINNYSQTISNQPKDESITTIEYNAGDALIETPLINNTTQAIRKWSISMDYKINENETNPIYNSATFYNVTNYSNKSDMIENIKETTPEHTENVPIKEGQLSIETTEMYIPSVITETIPKTPATIYSARKESTNKLDNYLLTTSNTKITKSFPPIESTTTMNVVAGMTIVENATEMANPNKDLPISTEKIVVPTNGSEYVNWMPMNISNIRDVKISTTSDPTTEIITIIKSAIEQAITVNSSIENVYNINTEENLVNTSNISETVTFKMNNKYNETRNKFSEISGPLLLTPAKITNYSQTISNQPKDESITTIEYNAGDALIETPLINNTTQAIRKWSISMDYKINENETNPIYNSATFYNVTNYRKKSDMIENIKETTPEHTENVPIKEGQLSIETTEMYIPSVITETIPKMPATIYSASKESTNKLDKYLMTTSNTKITKSFPPIKSTTTMNVVAGITIVENATKKATPNEDLPISTEKIEIPTNGSEYVNWMPMNISNIRDVKISTTSDPTTEIITTIKSAIEQAITVNSLIENVYNINTEENLVNTSNVSETVTVKMNNKHNETRKNFNEISGPLLLTLAKINNYSQTISNQPKDESITTIGYNAGDALIETPLINNTTQAIRKWRSSLDYKINENETNPIYNSATFYNVTNYRNKSDMIEYIKETTPEHTENVPIKEGQLSIETTEMYIPSVITETIPKTPATIYSASKESTNKLDNYLLTTSNTKITKSFPPIESTTTMNVVAGMTIVENATEMATPNEDLPISTEKIEVPTYSSEYVNWMPMNISNIRDVKISTTSDPTTEIITTIKSAIEQAITINSSIENVYNINTEENLVNTRNVSETVTVKMNNKYNETRNKFSEISGPLLLTPAKINNYSQTISNQPKDESITTIEYNAGDALIETPLINNTTQAIRKWSISMDYKINENETNPIYNSATFYNVTNYRNKSDMIENIKETTPEHTENVPIKEGQLSIETTEMYIPSVITETIPTMPATIYSASKESTNKLDNYLMTTSNTKITKSSPPIESTTTMNVVAAMTINNNNNENSEYRLGKNVSKATLNSTFRLENTTEMATRNEDLPLLTEKIEVSTNGSEYVNWTQMNKSSIIKVKTNTTFVNVTEANTNEADSHIESMTTENGFTQNANIVAVKSFNIRNNNTTKSDTIASTVKISNKEKSTEIDFNENVMAESPYTKYYFSNKATDQTFNILETSTENIMGSVTARVDQITTTNNIDHTVQLLSQRQIKFSVGQTNENVVTPSYIATIPSSVVNISIQNENVAAVYKGKTYSDKQQFSTEYITWMDIPTVIPNIHVSVTPATLMKVSEESTNKLHNFPMPTTNTNNFSTDVTRTITDINGNLEYILNTDAYQPVYNNENFSSSTEHIITSSNSTESGYWIPKTSFNVNEVKLISTADAIPSTRNTNTKQTIAKTSSKNTTIEETTDVLNSENDIAIATKKVLNIEEIVKSMEVMETSTVSVDNMTRIHSTDKITMERDSNPNNIVINVFPENNNIEILKKSTPNLNYTETESTIKNTLQKRMLSTDKIPPFQNKTVVNGTSQRYPLNIKNLLNFDCSHRSPGKYPDNDDCRTFYICVAKSLSPVVKKCPEDTVFSDIRKQCTKYLAHCIRNNEFYCPSEGRFSDITKDNYYYICVINKQNRFIKFKFQCQVGYHLNASSVKCVQDIVNPTSNLEPNNSENGSTSKTIMTPKVSSLEQKESIEDIKCRKEGKFADPLQNDCRKYYECAEKNNQFSKKIKRCGSDEVFDSEKKSTNIATSRSRPEISTETNKKRMNGERTEEARSSGQSIRDLENSVTFDCRHKNRGKYADHNDCKTYYVCIGKNNPLIRYCPEATVFSNIENKCTENLSHCIRQNEFRCTNDGKFIDILKNNYYYICVKNNADTYLRYHLKCEDGYDLDKSSIKCTRQENYESSSLSKEKIISASKQDSKESGQTSRDTDFKCVEEGKFSDPYNSNKYYVCSKKHGSYRKKKKKCKNHKIFHNVRKLCVSAKSYE